MGLELLKKDFEECLYSLDPATAWKFQEKKSDWLSIMSDVEQNVHNSISVLNDILDFDKVEEGTLQMEHEV